MPYHVYILTTKKNTTLYTGVTSDLQSRIWQHKEGLIEGFSKKNTALINWFMLKNIKTLRKLFIAKSA
jgi:predicted GIY-YIG superfamily endonuclease